MHCPSSLINNLSFQSDEWKSYTEWKQKQTKEIIGSSRYFNFAKICYESINTLRPKPHFFIRPPVSWMKRLSTCPHPNPINFTEIMDELVQFTTSRCKNAERSNWNSVLQPLQPGSLERVLWAIAFLKSTNGVADAVSCGHFRCLIQKSLDSKIPKMSLDICDNPLLLASWLRQTSKWVKNTFILIKIFRHIKDQWCGVATIL